MNKPYDLFNKQSQKLSAFRPDKVILFSPGYLSGNKACQGQYQNDLYSSNLRETKIQSPASCKTAEKPDKRIQIIVIEGRKQSVRYS